MKLLSIAIPCYNSEKYMRKCIDSLLIGGEDVEILIIDDGSTKDRTAEIADVPNGLAVPAVRRIWQDFLVPCRITATMCKRILCGLTFI